ncbi:hypothetical protein PILCRDRAFT_811373 [Piloderma croceum F 1598]|uniref:Uncharacterized protein n=1 Tax=Piloderma croceum (strain F 1598) TaxID=765440 RepID=A0A0C3GGV5_PILCF|nr:hypothetical protein PILCRDRAFT_811373 [Piloderma croceum F 1598]
MDYTPRHPQPFTLEQAILLDVAVLSEEITRLQNSLQHLKGTQEELRQHVATSSSPDPDFIEAILENEEVIGSQEERVVILRLALAHKGASTNSGHYDLTPSRSSATNEQSQADIGDEGVHL